MASRPARWPLKDHNRLILKHLQQGDGMQRAAARSVKQTRILKLLEPYTPLIVGTLPIDVHLPGSDLDIICQVKARATFAALLVRQFGKRPHFALRRTTLQKRPAIVCRFGHRDTLFEIVGMPIKTPSQRAYVHLMVEADLLNVGGRAARAAIRRLKHRGLKTEPAFAEYFGLGGKPYHAIAKLWRGIDRPLAIVSRHPQRRDRLSHGGERRIALLERRA